MSVRKEFADAEKRLKPAVSNLFEDVFDEVPVRLQRQVRSRPPALSLCHADVHVPCVLLQEQEMRAHIAKYPEEYPTDKHEAQRT